MFHETRVGIRQSSLCSFAESESAGTRPISVCFLSLYPFPFLPGGSDYHRISILSRFSIFPKVFPKVLPVRMNSFSLRVPEVGMVSETCAFALHDDALAAAACALAGLAHVHLTLWCAGTEGTGAGGVGRHFLVVAADLADEVVEGVLDVDAGLGGGLNELAAELSGQGLTLCREELGGALILGMRHWNLPCSETTRSFAKSHLLPTTMMGK